ncbi:MAG TPA: hypothetical protein VJM53_03770 [Burkholderiales bacterium]|nr:hypothetical protein [Burkholderiales bacterium]
MNQEERVAQFRLALLAYFANGTKDERELVQLRRVLETLSPVIGANLSLILQEVQLKRCSIQTAVAALIRPEYRQLAYESAVCVCDVDGIHSDTEHRFLEDLRIALALDVRSARSFERTAGAIADLTLQPDPVRGFSAPADARDSEALDQSIQAVAAFCGALAHVGTALTGMAIIPSQMKMIYRVAKAYGEESARGQIKDLMVVFGAAALPQYIENFGYALADQPGQAAAGAYANTYALGHAAKFYYASDIDVELQQLHERFEEFSAEGRRSGEAHAAEIADQSRILNSNELLSLLRQR